MQMGGMRRSIVAIRCAASAALLDRGTGCQRAIEYGLNVRTTSRVDARIDSARRCVSGAVPRFRPAPAHGQGEPEGEEVR